MELPPGPIIGKLLQNDQKKINAFLALEKIDDKVENLFFCESVQKIFGYKKPENSQKSEGKNSYQIMNHNNLF